MLQNLKVNTSVVSQCSESIMAVKLESRLNGVGTSIGVVNAVCLIPGGENTPERASTTG